MAVSESDDDASPENTPTDLPTGYECPDCGADTLDGKGLYACVACEWISVL